MLTDKQIEDLSMRLNVPLGGVFFKDKIPKEIKPNKTYIINLQDSKTDSGEYNSGTHWVMLQVNKSPKGNYKSFYFDSYGAPPPENVKKEVQKQFKQYLPFNNVDIQSLMNNACGYYCLAIAHYINVYKDRSGDLYTDASQFIDLFDDLNTSIDWKKNEYVLKMFFQSSDKNKRKPINVLSPTHDDYERIINKGCGRKDMMKIPVDTKIN